MRFAFTQTLTTNPTRTLLNSNPNPERYGRFALHTIFDLAKSRRIKRNLRKEPFKSSQIPKFGGEML